MKNNITIIERDDILGHYDIMSDQCIKYSIRGDQRRNNTSINIAHLYYNIPKLTTKIYESPLEALTAIMKHEMDNC